MTRKPRKFLGLERATIAEWQGASEDQKFAAKLTQFKNRFFSLFRYKSLLIEKNIINAHERYTEYKQRKPNKVTIKAIKQSELGKNLKKFDSLDDLFLDLFKSKKQRDRF